MKFLLGTKQGMTQVFDGAGNVHPVTILLTTPSMILQTKAEEKDGYVSVQLGFGTRKIKNISKAVRGHVKKLTGKEDTGFSHIKEFRNDISSHKAGELISADIFKEGDIVNVSAISKGKGFQGVVKRHGFHGGPRSHGQKHTERSPGSIGAQGPQKVHKGRKMPGRMGGDRVTVKNLKIIKVDAENNQLMIRGAIPGKSGTLVEVRSNS